MGICGECENRNEWLEAFGKSIQKRREDKGLAKHDVIAELHIGFDTIRAVELGFGTMRLDSFLRLANFLDMDLCDNVNEVGRRIAACRAQRQKSRWELAEVSGITERTIRNAEKRSMAMYMDTFLRICESLDVAPTELLKK